MYVALVCLGCDTCAKFIKVAQENNYNILQQKDQKTLIRDKIVVIVFFISSDLVFLCILYIRIKPIFTNMLWFVFLTNNFP